MQYLNFRIVKRNEIIYYIKRNSNIKSHQRVFCLYLNYLILGGSIAGRGTIGRTTATVLKFISSNIKNKPVEMESMLYPRKYHACTIFKSALHDNRPIIIVAGSYDYFCDRCESNTAEVLDFTQEGTSWQESIRILHI